MKFKHRLRGDFGWAAGSTVLIFGVVFVGLFLSSACSKTTRPYNHPNMGLYDRNASRIQLVPLIVDDEKRAAAVQAKYIEIEELVQAREAVRLAEIQKLTALSSDYAFPEEEVRQRIVRFGKEGSVAYRKYVKLQMEIRKNTTQQEFARLDKVR